MKRGKIELVVKSRKTPVRVENILVPMPNTVDPTLKQTISLVIYDYVLDDHQSRVVEEARELAQRYGLRLDVIDSARGMIAKRILRRVSIAIQRVTGIWQIGVSERPERSLDERQSRMAVNTICCD